MNAGARSTLTLSFARAARATPREMAPDAPAPPSGPDPSYWIAHAPIQPALFVPPSLLSSLLSTGAATPADAALLVRVGELGRALDTGLAVARAQWAGWCGQQVG